LTVPPKMFPELPARFTLASYLNLKELLSSSNVYSGNLDEPEALSRNINRVAKIDRLPTHNSLEALSVLRNAWDAVDIFSSVALRCKLNTKVSYALLLLLGMSVTMLVTFGLNRPDELDETNLKISVAALSLLTSLIASFVTYFNPSTKWLQLRGASLAIESEVWKFRTRTGPYSIAVSRSAGSRQAEERLHSFVESLNQHVMKSASVAETAFFANYKVHESNPKSANWYRHGQRAGSSILGTYGVANLSGEISDDHQSPVNPTDYLELRVVPLVSFYQGRLPRYYHRRTGTELFLIIAGLGSTLLALTDFPSWAPMIVAMTAALTSWQEFQSTSKKLTRYSDVVHSLTQVVHWWEQLTDVDRASLDNIEELILSCEDLFATERQAWLSTSMISKMLSTQAARHTTEVAETSVA